jgi:hypothetical protein
MNTKMLSGVALATGMTLTGVAMVLLAVTGVRDVPSIGVGHRRTALRRPTLTVLSRRRSVPTGSASKILLYLSALPTSTIGSKPITNAKYAIRISSRASPGVTQALKATAV